jgi:hypothetical protein
MAMDLALLAVQTAPHPVGDVVGEPTPNKSRRHKMPGGVPPRMGNVVEMHKMYFLNFAGTMGRKQRSAP